MKIRLTIEIDDRARRALRQRLGQPGLATRDEIRALVNALLDGDVADALSEAAGEDMRTEVRG
jgi:hypothetical protein